jgi:hypothetical protein
MNSLALAQFTPFKQLETVQFLFFIFYLLIEQLSSQVRNFVKKTIIQIMR